MVQSAVTPDTPAVASTRLPADLAKLRDRFLCEYPQETDRVAMLAQVPAALRHMLSLRLELDRTDALPRRYRDLAIATMHAGTPVASADAVEQVVVSYALAARRGKLREGDTLLPQLRRFFTEPQVVELVLALTQSQAFAMFDAMLKV
jgi:hypothetical protein